MSETKMRVRYNCEWS